MTLETLLAKADSDVAIDAIYYFARLIKHRDPSLPDLPSLIVEGVASEPSAEAERLALELAKAEEAQSGVALQKLTDAQAAQLLGRLEERMLERFDEGSAGESSSGESLLEALRKHSTV